MINDDYVAILCYPGMEDSTRTLFCFPFFFCVGWTFILLSLSPMLIVPHMDIDSLKLLSS